MNLSAPLIEVSVERAVAGGWMIARHDGRIVFVSGAIPGERVRARVTKTTRGVSWAETVDVLDASADRRTPPCDLACGGSLYAHIDAARQLALKRDVIVDAFRRIGKITIAPTFGVAASEPHGYRLRARLHVRDGRAGFLREGTHQLCDAGSTSQLLPETIASVQRALVTLGTRVNDCASVVVAENIDASERVLHLEPQIGATLDELLPVIAVDGVTGVSTVADGHLAIGPGVPTVTDTAAELLGADSPIPAETSWTRHAPSFFQGNRFLAGALVRHVLAHTTGDRCIDLYAGVGLFAVALAARGSRVIAVEGDRSSGTDLAANARPWMDRLEPVNTSVESFASRRLGAAPDAVVLDPPRTGASPEALAGLVSWRARRIVYVSCDPPTLARDAAKLVGAGYSLTSIDAFDLFPNTPHVEAIAVFDVA